MKKYLVKCKGRYIVVWLCDDMLLFPIEIHQLEAKKIATGLNRSILRSNNLVCDYFGGTSKVYDYSQYSTSWVLAG